MPSARRKLGRTGVQLSVVGFPGLALIHYDQEKCTTALHEAFERGVNYFDVAPPTATASARLKWASVCRACRGQILPGLQDEKTGQGGRHGGNGEIAEAAQDRPFRPVSASSPRPTGPRQTGPRARRRHGSDSQGEEQGKVQHIGYSAHTTKAALTVMEGFKFDTVMFPINFVEFYTRGFGKEVLDLAAKQGAGVLAIKPLSWEPGRRAQRKPASGGTAR